MTIAPLPKLIDIFKIFSYKTYRNKYQFSYESWKSKDDIFGVLSRSSWSIALISKWKIEKENRKIKIWIPDYFCESALTILRNLDVDIIFYNITEQLVPDKDNCNELAKKYPPDIILFVHYFGIPLKSVFLYDLCKKYNSWLIEDATHSLNKNEKIGHLGDFILYSPYKHLPIPDGAILILKNNGPSNFEPKFISSLGAPKNWPYQLASLRKQLKICGFNSDLLSLKWLMKKCIQILGFFTYNSNKIFSSDSKINIGNSNLPSPQISKLGFILYNINTRNIKRLINVKLRNLTNCDEVILNLNLSNTKLTNFFRPDFNEWTPYMATFKTDYINFQINQDKYLKLKLPVLSWPDLPSEVIQSKNSIALKLKNSFIHLPIHESISDYDYFKYSLKFNNKKFKTFDNEVIEIIDDKKWFSLLSSCENNNILQSWVYGNTKAKTDKLNAKRFLFQINGKPIAIFQVLIKSFLFIKILRINRGPLFIKNESSLQNKKRFFEIISNFASWNKILFITPELFFNGENDFLLKEFGFNRFSENEHESIIINLKYDLEFLRKNMNPKWRNMLNNAEKKAVTVEVSNNIHEIRNIIDLNNIDQKNRNYKGIGKHFNYNLLENHFDDNFLTLFSAKESNNIISGIIIFENNKKITYYIGWNNETGRNLKANYLLIWKAIIHYKAKGFIEFDLGGIDEILNPNVSYFKLGVGGERYKLIGDYFKWL